MLLKNNLLPFFQLEKPEDRELKDYPQKIKSRNLPLVDLAEKHIEDFRDYKCDMNTYLARYFIGHYNPSGNFFCAHAIRDKLLEMNDPKPAAYTI